MKKYAKIFWKAGILITTVLLTLLSCLNPIGFNPELNLNITGDITTTDITSAVLMISNRSKTVDVKRITITQPEVPETFIRFTDKPLSLKNKAQYVKPSDKEYLVEIEYVDRKDPGNIKTGRGEVTISAPIPKETYWIYL